jgi:hypothetical protein
MALWLALLFYFCKGEMCDVDGSKMEIGVVVDEQC